MKIENMTKDQLIDALRDLEDKFEHTETEAKRYITLEEAFSDLESRNIE